MGCLESKYDDEEDEKMPLIQEEGKPRLVSGTQTRSTVIERIMSFFAADDIALRSSSYSLDIGLEIVDAIDQSFKIKWDSHSITVDFEKARVDLFKREIASDGKTKFLPMTSLTMTPESVAKNEHLLEDLEDGADYGVILYLELKTGGLVNCGRCYSKTKYRFGPPKEFVITETTSSSFAVKWSPPQSHEEYEVTLYKIVLSTEVDDFVVSSSIPVDVCEFSEKYSPMYTSPNEAFTLKLAAYSEKLERWSEDVIARKERTNPPTGRAVVDVTCITKKKNIDLVVKFSHNFGEDYTSFVYKYWKKQEDEYDAKTATLPKGVESFKIENVLDTTFYVVSVAAKNRYGLSQFTSKTWGTPPAPPLLSNIVLGRGMITIGWKPQLEGVEGLLPKLHRVRYRFANPIADWSTCREIVSENEVELTGLSDSNSYVVELSAVNGFGASLCYYERIDTLQSLSKPTNVEIDANYTSAKVKWTPSSHDPSIVPDRYMLEMRKEEREWSLVLMDLPFASTEYTFDDLEGGFMYYFRITPHDMYGNGAAAIASVYINTLPPAVEDIAFSTITESTISVSFAVPRDVYDMKDAVDGLFMFIREELNVSEQKTHTITSRPFLAMRNKRAKPYEFVGLRPSTSYVFGIGYESGFGHTPYKTAVVGTAPSPPNSISTSLTEQGNGVNIFWEQPTEIQEKIESGQENYVELSGYVVEKRIGNSISSTEVCESVGPSATSVTVSGLKRTTTYVFSVRAKNRYATGKQREINYKI